MGAYFVDSQFVEKAIQYFERAAVVQPQNVKWRLMVASCHRRSGMLVSSPRHPTCSLRHAGNYQKAFETYKEINHKFPDNVDCKKNVASSTSAS